MAPSRNANRTLGRPRIDKWLWAARFYKTRSLAARAVEGGKVKLNGERMKPGKEVKAGDDERGDRGNRQPELLEQNVRENQHEPVLRDQAIHGRERVVATAGRRAERSPKL